MTLRREALVRKLPSARALVVIAIVLLALAVAATASADTSIGVAFLSVLPCLLALSAARAAAGYSADGVGDVGVARGALVLLVTSGGYLLSVWLGNVGPITAALGLAGALVVAGRDVPREARDRST